MATRFLFIILAVLVVVSGKCNTAVSSETNNVAFGKTVAAKGEFFTYGWGNGLIVDYSTLTDSVFFPKGQVWDQGPIWWDENLGTVQNSLTVFLGATYEVREIIIQVDNNDDYLISWEDVNNGSMELVVIPGPSPGMDAPIAIKVDAVTDAFTIEHDPDGRGDGWYSVSEFRAIGVPAVGKAKKEFLE